MRQNKGVYIITYPDGGKPITIGVIGGIFDIERAADKDAFLEKFPDIIEDHFDTEDIEIESSLNGVETCDKYFYIHARVGDMYFRFTIEKSYLF